MAQRRLAHPAPPPRPKLPDQRPLVWAELATIPLNPSATRTSVLAQRVAVDLVSAGLRFERVLTDSGSDLRLGIIGATGRARGASLTFIWAERPAAMSRGLGSSLTSRIKPYKLAHGGFSEDHAMVLAVGAGREIGWGWRRTSANRQTTFDLAPATGQQWRRPERAVPLGPSVDGSSGVSSIWT